MDASDDPSIVAVCDFSDKIYDHLVANPSRLTDEIPIFTKLHYDSIESLPELETNVWKRCVDLDSIMLHAVQVQDIDRF